MNICGRLVSQTALTIRQYSLSNERLRRELEGRSTICCGETLARLLFDLAFDSVGFKACVGCCESEVTSKDLELCRVLAVLRVAEPFSFTPFYGARVLRVQ